MSYQDHLTTCDYCSQKQKGASSLSLTTSKPTIYVRSRASYDQHKSLGELGAIIRGTSYPSLEPLLQTKGASSEVAAARKPGYLERAYKLRELGRLVRG